MKVNQLFVRKSPGPKVLAPALTPEQAMANRALYEQEIGPMGDSATVYFREFVIGKQYRNWLLPAGSGETWRDLTDEQVNFVCCYMEWFKKQIAAIHERYNEQVPMNWDK